MKHILIALLCISLGAFLSCNSDDDPLVDPVTCSDGIQNQDEAGIDCGGEKCIRCFDCYSDFCTYLSGSTFDSQERSVTWDCVLFDGREFLPKDEQDNVERIFAADHS